MFELEGSVEPKKDQVWITSHRPADLQYTIKNISAQPPQETQFGSSDAATPTSEEASPTGVGYRLGYEISADKKVWSLQDHGQGIIDIPEPQQSVVLSVGVVPNGSGPLPMPELVLKWVPVVHSLGGGAANKEGCVLTSAQVHNICHNQRVTVQSPTGAGR